MSPPFSLSTTFLLLDLLTDPLTMTVFYDRFTLTTQWTVYICIFRSKREWEFISSIHNYGIVLRFLSGRSVIGQTDLFSGCMYPYRSTYTYPCTRGIDTFIAWVFSVFIRYFGSSDPRVYSTCTAFCRYSFNQYF